MQCYLIVIFEGSICFGRLLSLCLPKEGGWVFVCVFICFLSVCQ